MIFKEAIVRADMQTIHRSLDEAIQTFYKFIKDDKVSGKGFDSAQVQERLQRVTGNLFLQLNGIATHEVYGKVSLASKETRDFIYPYFGKGFVRYAVRFDVRRFVLYRSDGSMLEVKQMRNGYVTLGEGRYKQIKGLVMVEEQWTREVEKRKKKMAK